MEDKELEYREKASWVAHPFEIKMLIAAGLAIVLAAIAGFFIHRSITPSLSGNYSGKVADLDGLGEAWDSITFMDDHTFLIFRTVTLQDGSGQVAEVKGSGKWSEKKNYFLLKWKPSDSTLLEEVYKHNGKAYKVRSFVDRRIRVSKKQEGESLLISYKRNGNWIVSVIKKAGKTSQPAAQTSVEETIKTIRYYGSLSDDADSKQSYDIAMVLNYNVSHGTVEGYQWYRKYEESHHVNVSGTFNKDSIQLVSEKGTEEYELSYSGDLFEKVPLLGIWRKYDSDEDRRADRLKKSLNVSLFHHS